MFVDVTGSMVKNQVMKEGRFLINPDFITMLEANGTKATFHLSDGAIIYSDANLTEILKKIDDAKLFS